MIVIKKRNTLSFWWSREISLYAKKKGEKYVEKIILVSNYQVLLAKQHHQTIIHLQLEPLSLLAQQQVVLLV